jgi:pantetheine-phosphate adenylyltransferase
LRCFDELIVLVGYNPVKTFLFTVEERVTMIKELVGENPRLKVDSYRGLIVDYVDKTDANVILRGLRAMSDFEYEFQMALINRKLHKSIETVFLMTGAQWFYVNSRIIKEAASMGGSVKGLVPENVLRRLKDKYPGFKNDS